jgi:transcriptional regulator with XRE-family HTH domain
MKMIKHPFSGRVTPEGDIGYDYRRKVGNHVRDLRERAGLTQRELGNLVGVTNNAVSAIELGRNPIPPERYMDFAKALQVDPRAFGEFLLEYTDPWLFELIHGRRKASKHELSAIPSRVTDTRKED